jgi:hypothetical protein
MADGKLYQVIADRSFRADACAKVLSTNWIFHEFALVGFGFGCSFFNF